MEKIRHLTIVTKMELGGAQQVALYTLEHLPQASFERYFISGTGGQLDAQVKALPGVTAQFWKSFKHPIRPLCDLWTAWKLVRFMREHKIQIVHTHSSKAGLLGRLAARWARVPVVMHTVHGWPFHDYQNPWLRRVYVALEQLAARWTTCLVAVSQATRDKGLRHGIGRADQYAVIFPGSDLSGFKPATPAQRKAVRKELGIPEKAQVVGMVACFKPQKAPLDFIRAAGLVQRTLPDAWFVLVGDGVLRPQIEAAASAAGLTGRLVLTGWRQDVAHVMHALDVVAHSSLWEGLPCVFAQALATGLPVVATDVEGAREIIQEAKNGHLVPPGKPEALAAGLVTLLTHPKALKALRQRAPQGAKPFTFQVMQESILKLYQKHLQFELKPKRKPTKYA